MQTQSHSQLYAYVGIHNKSANNGNTGNEFKCLEIIIVMRADMLYSQLFSCDVKG